MKHLPLLLLSSFAMMASAGHPPHPAKTPFTGFSVIGQAGGILGKADLTQEFDALAPPSTPLAYTNDANIPQGGATGGLGLAYSHQFKNGLVLAGVLTAGFNYITFEGKTNGTSGSPGFVTAFSQGELNTTLQNDFALLFKPGVAVGKTLVYGLIGPRWGNFKSTFDNQFTVTFIGPPQTLLTSLPYHATQSAYHMGIAVGAGLSQKLWSHVVAGVEYQYTTYNNGIASFNTHGTSPADTPIISNNANYTAHSSVDRINTNTLMATIAYQF